MHPGLARAGCDFSAEEGNGRMCRHAEAEHMANAPHVEQRHRQACLTVWQLPMSSVEASRWHLFPAQHSAPAAQP